MSHSFDQPSGETRTETGRPPTTVRPTDEPSVGIDEIFGVLKNQRRRSVLRYLETADGPVRLGDLAEQIAAWENGKDRSLLTSQERKRVYVGLYQCHLPKMDDTGAVSFDKPRGIIEQGENGAIFYRYLPDEESAGSRPPEGYDLDLPPLSALFLPILVLVEAYTSIQLSGLAVVALVVGLLVLAGSIPKLASAG